MGSVVICLDEMGPLSAKSYPGREPVRTRPPPAGRARQEIDYGRRGKGYVFGAFCPATGAAFTRPYPGRGAAHWVAFLEEVELWLPGDAERIYAIADDLSSHRATDVLLFMLAHPRWEIVFQPKYAAYLNLIEPWWRVLRSLALAGRRFETWDEVCEGRRASNRLLERPPPSLRLGTKAPPPSPTPARYRPPAKGRVTCRMDH